MLDILSGDSERLFNLIYGLKECDHHSDRGARKIVQELKSSDSRGMPAAL